jgi:hypothetical protein
MASSIRGPVMVVFTTSSRAMIISAPILFCTICWGNIRANKIFKKEILKKQNPCFNTQALEPIFQPKKGKTNVLFIKWVLNNFVIKKCPVYKDTCKRIRKKKKKRGSNWLFESVLLFNFKLPLISEIVHIKGVSREIINLL